MAYEVPPLPYDFAALEPHIDAKTMEIHHDKHHQAYVDKVNAALEGTDFDGKPIEEVLKNLDALPSDKQKAVRNNGGGHYNHSLFWEWMSPDGGGEPDGDLAEAINSAFGSFSDFQAKFKETGKELDPATCESALALTGGHPYATQELLYFLWEEGTLDRALEATLRSEHSHFSLVWDNISGAQKRVLQALAQEGPGRPLSSDYQRRHSLPATPTVQTALTALDRAELVQRVGRGEYRIAEPFLTEWIQRYES